MQKGMLPGKAAREVKGWWLAYRWLILRRISQLSVLGIFMAGPLLGIWLVKGNLASSLTLDFLPLTDPLLTAQMLLAGHIPESTAIIGTVIVLCFYFLIGGRVYCSWVCPVNIVTDSADWLRRKLKLKGAARWNRNIRYWLLAGIMVLAATTGTLAWELINPVSVLFRGLVFGMGFGWMMIISIFLLDLLVAKRAWCSHLCPVGAFYSLLNYHPELRITADKRIQCDDCMDCFTICPENQVIKPALKGAKLGNSPIILNQQCTNCGRCADVCAQDVFHFTLIHRLPESLRSEKQREVSS